MMNRFVALAMTFTVLSLTTALVSCSNASEASALWDSEFVAVHKVEGFLMDGKEEEFAGGLLMSQFSESAPYQIASLDPNVLPASVYRRSRDAGGDEDELLATLPTPDHVWLFSPALKTAVYEYTTDWESSDVVLLNERKNSSYHRRQYIRENMLDGKPGWWPKDLELQRNSEGYGTVMPGRDAVYYISNGTKLAGGRDVWGEVNVYQGPAWFVINHDPMGSADVAVYELNPVDMHRGVSVVMSSDGNYVVLTVAAAERLVWVIDLR